MNALLGERSQLPAFPPVEIARPPAPEEAHGTARFALGFVAEGNRSYEEISMRAALHDLASDPTGFPVGSELEMFSARGRWDNQRRELFPEELTLINIKSFSAWDPWVRSPSWGVKTGFAAAHDLGRPPESSLTYTLNGGSGFAVSILPAKKGFVYCLLKVEGDAGGSLERHYRAGAGPSVGLAIYPSHRWRFESYGEALRFGLGAEKNLVRMQATQSLSIFRNFEWRASVLRENDYLEESSSFNYLF